MPGSRWLHGGLTRDDSPRRADRAACRQSDEARITRLAEAPENGHQRLAAKIGGISIGVHHPSPSSTPGTLFPAKHSPAPLYAPLAQRRFLRFIPLSLASPLFSSDIFLGTGLARSRNEWKCKGLRWKTHRHY